MADLDFAREAMAAAQGAPTNTAGNDFASLARAAAGQQVLQQAPPQRDTGLVNVPGETEPGVVTNQGGLTNEDMDKMGIPHGGFADPVQAQQEANYQRDNAIPGVPLDTASGADALTRLRLGLHRSKLDQLDILRKLYGEDKVRLSSQNDFIVSTTDEQGKPKDLRVDESGLSAKDFLDVLHEVPALALSMLTTKGVPAGKVFQMALRGALGYAAGGSMTDYLARVFEGQPTQKAEIAGQRGQEAAVNTLAGYGIGKAVEAGVAGLRMIRGATSALADDTHAAAMSEINAARERVGDKFNIQFKPSVAEMTGNPMATRLESFLSNIPFARSMVLKNWQRAVENEKAVQGALGAKNVPTTGERLLNMVGGEMQRSEAMQAQAANVVRGQAEKAALGPLDDIAGGPLSEATFGQRMIRRGNAQLQSFKNKAEDLSSQFKYDPEALDPRFDATPILKRAQAIIDSPEVVKEAGGAVAKGLAPGGLMGVLEQLKRLPDKQSLMELKSLREAIYDRIGSPEPISDKASRLLKDVGRAVTDVMESQGPTAMGNKWPAVQAFNKFYRENVESFYQKGISGMLQPRTEAGAIDPERIAANVLAGGKGSITAYSTLASFFEKPQAVQDMNRLLRDEVLKTATDEATGLVKLESLGQAVNKLAPEIAQKLFNAPKEQVLQAIQQGQLAQRVVGKAGAVPMAGTQAAVEASAFNKMVEDGTINSIAVKKLASHTADLRNQYVNTVRKATAAGDMGIIQASPETFIDNVVFNPSVPPQDLKNIMQSVYRTGDEEFVKDVKGAYLWRLFRDSAKGGRGDPTQTVARVKGLPLEVDPQTLAIKLDEDMVRHKVVLGDEAAKDLQDFALAISGRAGRDIGGVLTGVFTGGKLFENLWSGLQGLPEIARYSTMSYIMTSPRTMQALKGVARLAPEKLDGAMRAAVLTPEFLHSVVSNSPGPNEARVIAESTQKWAKQGARVQ